MTDAQAPLLVLGTRPFSAEIADLAGDAGYEVVGFVENLSRERCDDTLEGLPIHWIDELGDLVATHLAVCGLGTTRRSIFVEQAADRGLRFATVIHPTARVSRASSIGEGSIVSAGVTVASHAVVGRHVLLNRGALVGHHTLVGDYASIMAGANVAGHCRIGEQVFLGMGSIVIDHISVGPGSVVGAGAVVTKDVPGSVEVIGVPARIAKEGIEAR